jgi:hypothetical protein
MSSRSWDRDPHGTSLGIAPLVRLVPLARLAQLVERKTFNLVVVGSSPTVGIRLISL